ncbi:hypothetical protein RI054_14g70550 [Pseudoscourfieldia marina]
MSYEEETPAKGTTREALSGNEDYSEADGKLKAFNQRCDSYSVISKPQTLFLKPWEELVVKLQAKPSQEEAKRGTRGKTGNEGTVHCQGHGGIRHVAPRLATVDSARSDNDRHA